jgi:hypothetical protein
MSAQVAAVCRSGYYQLRRLRTVIRSLTADAKRTLVQTFIFSRLDYYNSLLFGISDGLIRRLQSLQNAATRMITGARYHDHITPVLHQLHWLPVRQRIRYKVAVLVYKSLHGLAPDYLAADCHLSTAATQRSLRSGDSITLHVPRTRTKFGDRSFTVAGPAVWNSLPPALRSLSLSLPSFARLLKTVLFV